MKFTPKVTHLNVILESHTRKSHPKNHTWKSYSKVIPKTHTRKSHPKLTLEITPKSQTQKSHPKVTLESGTAKSHSKITPKVALKVAPKVTKKVAHKVTPNYTQLKWFSHFFSGMSDWSGKTCGKRWSRIRRVKKSLNRKVWNLLLGTKCGSMELW